MSRTDGLHITVTTVHVTDHHTDAIAAWAEIGLWGWGLIVALPLGNPFLAMREPKQTGA